MENLTGDGEFKELKLGEKDLQGLVRQLMAENEEQGRDMRRLERRITELDVCKEVLKKYEDESKAFTIGDVEEEEKRKLRVWSPVVILCREVVMVKNGLPGCLIFMTSVSIWKWSTSKMKHPKR